MKTDRILKLIQQKKTMRSGGALPLPKAQTGQQTGWAYDETSNSYLPEFSLPEVQVTAERPGLFKQMRKKFMDSYNPFLPSTAQPGLIMEALGVPQQALMYGLTGQYARPSEIYPTKGIGNFGNKFNDFMFDVVTDPLAYLAEASQLRGALRGPKKVPASLADEPVFSPAYYESKAKLDEARQRLIDAYQQKLKPKSLEDITKDIDALNESIVPRSEATTEDLQSMLERLQNINKDLEKHIPKKLESTELGNVNDISKFEKLGNNYDSKLATSLFEGNIPLDPTYTNRTLFNIQSGSSPVWDFNQQLNQLRRQIQFGTQPLEKPLFRADITKSIQDNLAEEALFRDKFIQEQLLKDALSKTVDYGGKPVTWSPRASEYKIKMKDYEPFGGIEAWRQGIYPNQQGGPTKHQSKGEVNPLLNIPESQRFPQPVQSSVPLNFMGQPYATGAIEESVSPLDIIGGVRGGVGLSKGLMKYRQAMKPNYVQIGDELFNMGAHPRAVRRAINQMNKGASDIVLPAPFSKGGVLNMNTNKMLNYINASYQKGGGIKDMVVSEIWEKVTGTKWSQAKKLGLSDGSYETNIKLRQMLINEAMQPKPNFGKFIGQPSSKLPAPSAIVNQLRQEGLAQASMPPDATARVKPIMSPIAPASPSKQQPAQKRTYPKVEIPGYHTAPPNTSATAKRQMQRVEGLTPVTSVKSVPLQKVQTPTQAVAMPSSTRVAAPTMSPVVGRAPVPLPQQAEKPQLALVNPPVGQPTYSEQDKPESAPSDLSTMGTLSMLNMAPVVGGVQAATTYGPMMARNAAYEIADAGLNMLPSMVGNYVRGLTGMPITESNFTEEELRALGHAIAQGQKKGYGVPEQWKQLGYTGSFGYDEYPGGRDALNAFTGLTSPKYWGDGRALERIARITNNWSPLNAAYSVGMGNWMLNPDGKSYTVGDDYNFNRQFVKENPSSLPEWAERKGYGSNADARTEIKIPAEYVKKKGGSKQSLKIRIRKNG